MSCIPSDMCEKKQRFIFIVAKDINVSALLTVQVIWLFNLLILSVTSRRLFKKLVVNSKFDIYVYITIVHDCNRCWSNRENPFSNSSPTFLDTSRPFIMCNKVNSMFH